MAKEPLLTADGTFIYVGARVFIEYFFYQTVEVQVAEIKDNGIVLIRINNDMKDYIWRRTLFAFELYYSKEILEKVNARTLSNK